MEQVIELGVKTVSVILFVVIVIISIISHLSLKEDNIARAKETLRRSAKQTTGGRVFFYTLMFACVNGAVWGWTPFTYWFMFASMVSERLIVYRVCRGQKDALGRFLVKINW